MERVRHGKQVKNTKLTDIQGCWSCSAKPVLFLHSCLYSCMYVPRSPQFVRCEFHDEPHGSTAVGQAVAKL